VSAGYVPSTILEEETSFLTGKITKECLEVVAGTAFPDK
jgi:hypothetical protein